ncbi:translation initiation factor IF-2-like [Vulpes lagopus]|uniref:translation initiation factor IF-2-like n=1 Tax=Vulpes lagopus TaxID=494514 RepID=UPI001BCA3F1D|nr:translation initiation factor IF-2-like [Vulpes lagopus]
MAPRRGGDSRVFSEKKNEVARREYLSYAKYREISGAPPRARAYKSGGGALPGLPADPACACVHRLWLLLPGAAAARLPALQDADAPERGGRGLYPARPVEQSARVGAGVPRPPGARPSVLCRGGQTLRSRPPAAPPPPQLRQPGSRGSAGPGPTPHSFHSSRSGIFALEGTWAGHQATRRCEGEAECWEPRARKGLMDRAMALC